jgi:hypothetical protein
MTAIDPAGHQIIILAGEFEGEEGVCLGRANDTQDLWAVSPDSSNRIVNLRFETEFGVLVNKGQQPGKN